MQLFLKNKAQKATYVKYKRCEKTKSNGKKWSDWVNSENKDFTQGEKQRPKFVSQG